MFSGFYENAVATRDLTWMRRYWELFGYRAVAEGSLDADAAERLYGHRSELRALRLQNGDQADHGLIRIWQWAAPRNAGLQFLPPLTVGGRWFLCLCRDIWYIHDVYADARDAGELWKVSTPARGIIQGMGKRGTSIFDPPVGVREMMVLGEEVRHGFFQRYNYTRPGYGTINPDAPMGTSETTHTSFIIADDTCGSFYTDTLGMEIAIPLYESSGAVPGNTDVMMMQPEQRFTLQGFHTPGRDVGMFQFYKPLWEMEPAWDRARPGALGLCLATFLTDDAATWRERIAAAGAPAITSVCLNEFGEPSFSFIAPDGVFWSVVEQHA